MLTAGFSINFIKMSERTNDIKKLLGSMDASFAMSSIVPVELLLKALMEPDSELDRWITMATMKDEGRAYFIDNEASFRTLAFLHMISGVNLDDIPLSSSTIADLYYFIPNLKEALKKLRDGSSQQNIQDLMGFASIEPLENFILQLEQKSKSHRAAKLIEEPVSDVKVEEF